MLLKHVDLMLAGVHTRATRMPACLGITACLPACLHHDAFNTDDDVSRDLPVAHTHTHALTHTPSPAARHLLAAPVAPAGRPGQHAAPQGQQPLVQHCSGQPA